MLKEQSQEKINLAIPAFTYYHSQLFQLFYPHRSDSWSASDRNNLSIEQNVSDAKKGGHGNLVKHKACVKLVT